MIDLQCETVLSLSDAARELPRRRGGKRPHVATLYRWISTGVRGVRLEALRVGGTICTSREALQRFCERLTDPDSAKCIDTSRQRNQAAARAGAELEAEGL